MNLTNSFPDVSIADVTVRRGMHVRCTGGQHATRVAEALKQVDLGPAWPWPPIDVVVGEGDGVTRVGPAIAVALATRVRDRYSGQPIEIVFRDQFLAGFDEKQTVRAFVGQVLKRFVLHEVAEAVLFKGDLLDDPHAGGFR